MKIDIKKSCAHLQHKLKVAFSKANKPRISLAQLKGEAKIIFNAVAADGKVLLKRLRKLAGMAANISFRTMMIAASIGSATVATKATIDVIPYSKSQNIKLLNECNFALRDGKKCSPAAAAEKQRSNTALKDLGLFSAGFFGTMGFAYAAFPMVGTGRKKKPEAKPG